MTHNPLLETSKHPHHALAFDQFKKEHFIPALKESILQAKKNIDKIKSDPEVPNFENTIVALETSSELMDTVAGVYFNLFSAEADQEFQAMAGDFSKLCAEYGSDISLDLNLFKKVKTVYEKDFQSKNLNQEQKKLLEKTYKGFVRNGALLDEEKKIQLREIDQQLAVLGPQFSENVLKSSNAFEVLTEKKEDLAGLPESAVEAAALSAQTKSKKGWLFNLEGPSYVAVMTHADQRWLREKIWTAYNSRAYKNDHDNQDNIKKIVSLRHRRAQVLGYKNHSHYVLEERMAQSSEKVTGFLEKILNASRAAAERDVKEVKEFMKELGVTFELMPWDFAYYSEKLKQKKYGFDEEQLRPYFQLEKVVAGAFKLAEALYDISFKEVKNIPTYHSEVKTYEVLDAKTKEFVGLFYTDFFPRKTKKDGAWMTSYMDQGLFHQEIRRPHISIVCNFTKPTPTKPSLLTFREVETLFHEFGHALHGLLSTCHYRSVSGTNVYWDFVELPSQFMENFLLEKEVLDLFAEHYETHQKIPQELIDKLKRSAKFQAGYMSIRQVQFCLLDMAWHGEDHKEIKDVDLFEKTAIQRTRVMPEVEGVNTSCAFQHIFSGGYSSGYYSYKWAEVLDADAFEYFKENGLLNKSIAKKFRENVLSRGGSEHPMELYKRFRGREPDPDALLRRDGLI